MLQAYLILKTYKMNNKKQKIIEDIVEWLECDTSRTIRPTILRQRIFEALEEAKQPYNVLSNFIIENYPEKVSNMHDYEAIVNTAIELLSPIKKEIKDIHQKKVYQRLVTIALQQWNESKTDLSFHDWMEVRGLHMKGGFFEAIENNNQMPIIC